MTWTSDRSGIASSAIWCALNRPAITSANVASKTQSRWPIDHAMILAIMAGLFRLAGSGRWRFLIRLQPLQGALQATFGIDHELAGGHRPLPLVQAFQHFRYAVMLASGLDIDRQEFSTALV